MYVIDAKSGKRLVPLLAGVKATGVGPLSGGTITAARVLGIPKIQLRARQDC